MNFTSKKTSLVFLGLVSLVLSRIFFFLVDDPEGPNLLIVIVLAAFIYLLLFLALKFFRSL